MGKRFNKTDIGCYADGALGHGYVRERLADLIGDYCDGDMGELQRALRAEMSDAADEEYEAIEALNALCDDDVAFDFRDGDLVLSRHVVCPDCGAESEDGGNPHFTGCPALV